MITYEKEVFAECGAWKNFLELEDSLSLDELLLLFEASIERQNRLIKTVAAAMGAEIEEDYSESDSHKPAYLIDPDKGGQATPLFGEKEVATLPIGLGYSIIEE